MPFATKFKVLGFIASLLLVVSCQRGPDTEDQAITVFAAASLSDVLLEVGEAFEEKTGRSTHFNFAGSNVLAQQILASSRADLFISADEQWMDFLEERGRLAKASRQTLLSNRLVLVSSSHSEWSLDDVEGLCELPYRFLCIGDPEAVPAGRYARRWLEETACGERTAWEAAQGRVSPAPDVRAAMAQVAGRDDSIGIIYRTDFMRSGGNLRLLWEAPRSEVRYPVARIANGDGAENGEAFYRFLFSETAQRIFEKSGFERFEGL